MSKLINLARSSAVFLMGRESSLAKSCLDWQPVAVSMFRLQNVSLTCLGPPNLIYKRPFEDMWLEPVPKNLELLRGNIAENALTNVKVMDAAASDVCGETTIRIAHNLATASLVWHRNEPSAVEFSVNTVVIDELVKTGDLPPPSFVKIDVEGAEAFVVRGMLRTIAAAKPVLFIECSDAGREITWPLLRNLGYRCQSAITLRWIENLAEYRHSDFLWLPPERVAA
jgi:FkbM family methyltransferase